MNLQYDLIELYKALVFQVVTQSAEVTDYLQSNREFKTSNGWTIKLAKSPEIDIHGQVIYLQGSRSSKSLRPFTIWNIPQRLISKYVKEIAVAMNQLALIFEVKRFIDPIETSYIFSLRGGNHVISF